MPKAVDGRMVHDIFPEFIQLQFSNRPVADLGPGEENSVVAKARFRLLDANGDQIAVKVLSSELWSGAQELTLSQVTNNLESTLGAALTQARIALTGE